MRTDPSRRKIITHRPYGKYFLDSIFWAENVPFLPLGKFLCIMVPVCTLIFALKFNYF